MSLVIEVGKTPIAIHRFFYCPVVFYKTKENLKSPSIQEATENFFVFGVKNSLLDSPTGCSPIYQSHIIFTLWNIPVSCAVSHFETDTHWSDTAGQVWGRWHDS